MKNPLFNKIKEKKLKEICYLKRHKRSGLRKTIFVFLTDIRMYLCKSHCRQHLANKNTLQWGPPFRIFFPYLFRLLQSALVCIANFLRLGF